RPARSLRSPLLTLSSAAVDLGWQLDLRRPVLVGGRQDHRRARGDVRQRADLLQQVFQGGRGGDPDLQYVVLVARDAVARLDGREPLEPVGNVVGGGRIERLDRHEGGQREPDDNRVTQRNVTSDDALIFEPPHPLVHSGHRKPSLPGQFREAHAPVTGQQGHDTTVDLFHYDNLT